MAEQPWASACSLYSSDPSSDGGGRSGTRLRGLLRKRAADRVGLPSLPSPWATLRGRECLIRRSVCGRELSKGVRTATQGGGAGPPGGLVWIIAERGAQAGAGLRGQWPRAAPAEVGPLPPPPRPSASPGESLESLPAPFWESRVGRIWRLRRPRALQRPLSRRPGPGLRTSGSPQGIMRGLARTGRGGRSQRPSGLLPDGPPPPALPGPYSISFGTLGL